LHAHVSTDNSSNNHTPAGQLVVKWPKLPAVATCVGVPQSCKVSFRGDSESACLFAASPDRSSCVSAALLACLRRISQQTLHSVNLSRHLQCMAGQVRTRTQTSTLYSVTCDAACVCSRRGYVRQCNHLCSCVLASGPSVVAACYTQMIGTTCSRISFQRGSGGQDRRRPISVTASVFATSAADFALFRAKHGTVRCAVTKHTVKYRSAKQQQQEAQTGRTLIKTRGSLPFSTKTACIPQIHQRARPAVSNGLLWALQQGSINALW
jgi:hypothetical protein